MKGHLIQFMPNGIAPITEVNVLVRVLKVSVFDEIRKITPHDLNLKSTQLAQINHLRQDSIQFGH